MIIEEKIRNWLTGLKKFLLDKDCMDILNDGKRVLNYNETGMNICPKSGKIFGLKQIRNFYEV